MQTGEGVLEVAQVRDASVLLRAAARSPLKLLLPRNHGHAAWVFVTNLGGGLVDGDDVGLRVHVRAGAAALLTTQASTKVYRSPRGCAQRLHAEVEPGGLLVVLPDPVACFAGARFAQTSDVHLAEGASLVLVDSLTCGRAERGERWAFASYASRIRVQRGARTIVDDAIELDERHGPLAARLAGFEAVSTVLTIGPRAPALVIPAPARGAPFVAAASPLPDGGEGTPAGTLVRVAARTAERLHGGMRAMLSALPTLLGDDPFARKW